MMPESALVALDTLQGRASLYTQGILKPHVIAAAVEEVTESLAVAARVLAAEQPQACVRFVRNRLHPPEQTAETAHLVVKHLVLSLCTFLDSTVASNFSLEKSMPIKIFFIPLYQI